MVVVVDGCGRRRCRRGVRGRCHREHVLLVVEGAEAVVVPAVVARHVLQAHHRRRSLAALMMVEGCRIRRNILLLGGGFCRGCFSRSLRGRGGLSSLAQHRHTILILHTSSQAWYIFFPYFFFHSTELTRHASLRSSCLNVQIATDSSQAKYSGGPTDGSRGEKLLRSLLRASESQEERRRRPLHTSGRRRRGGGRRHVSRSSLLLPPPLQHCMRVLEETRREG